MRGPEPQYRSGGSGGRRQVYFDVVSGYANGIGLQITSDRRPQSLACLDVETTAMQRAFDCVAFQKAVGHQREGVGADIVRRVELTAEIIDRDLSAADVDSDKLAGVEL